MKTLATFTMLLCSLCSLGQKIPDRLLEDITQKTDSTVWIAYNNDGHMTQGFLLKKHDYEDKAIGYIIKLHEKKKEKPLVKVHHVAQTKPIFELVSHLRDFEIILDKEGIYRINDENLYYGDPISYTVTHGEMEKIKHALLSKKGFMTKSFGIIVK